MTQHFVKLNLSGIKYKFSFEAEIFKYFNTKERRFLQKKIVNAETFVVVYNYHDHG